MKRICDECHSDIHPKNYHKNKIIYKMVKIGINGFGRIGRHILKIAINKCKEKCATDVSRVLMVNDPNLNVECIGYQMKKDSLYGTSDLDIVNVGSALMIDGQRVEFTTERQPDKIPWARNQVEYIIDTTGHGTESTCKKASMFLTQGIKRVIVLGCADAPMFVFGVNHCCYDLEMKVISATTAPMNCLTSLVRVIHENFDIQEAMATILKPMTNLDRILDDNPYGGSCRSGRSALTNFTPVQTVTSKKNIGKILPELAGKLETTAIRIPVPIVGAVDLTAKLGKEAPYEVLKCRVKEASDTYMKGLLRYADEELVSSDVIGDPHSCVFDAHAGTGLTKCFVKVFAWYDGEYAMAYRLYDLANYIASRENCQPKK